MSLIAMSVLQLHSYYATLLFLLCSFVFFDQLLMSTISSLKYFNFFALSSILKGHSSVLLDIVHSLRQNGPWRNTSNLRFFINLFLILLLIGINPEISEDILGLG